MRRRVLSLALLLAAAWLAAGCSRTRPALETRATEARGARGSEALRALVDRTLEEQFRAFPLFATRAGVHSYDAELRGFTREEREAERKRLRATLEGLPRAVDRDQLSALDQADYDIFEAELRASLLDLEEIRPWERDPNTYIRFAGQAVFQLITRDFAPLNERMRSAIARMTRIPDVFTTGRKTLQKPPRIWTEIALQQVQGTRALYAKTLPGAFASVQDADLQAAFRREQARCLEAIDGYARFLREDLLPRSNGLFAIGEDLYRRKLLYEEGVTESIDSLLAWGQAELARTQAQFKEVARRIDGKRSALEVFRALGREHPKAEELVSTTAATLEEIRQFLIDRRIITVPSEVRARVDETPIFARALSFASMSIPGPFETKATEAYYYVTPPDPTWTPEQVEEHLSFYNAYALPIVSIHEAYPGHYVQFLWTNRVDSKVRKLFGSGSFSEGWGLYTEQMMLDEGYGGTGARADKLRLAQLSLYLQRLARYMVGLSLHTRGMSYEEAARFFEEQAYMTRTNAEREARRGTSDPTYLVYALGKKMILELREDARAKWGAEFTVQHFHDQLVAYGYPPIPILRRLMLGPAIASPARARISP
jgi:uncharacterized protein (DUF885 family)